MFELNDKILNTFNCLFQIKEENFSDDDDETEKSLTEDEEDPLTHLEETLKAESNTSNQQSTFHENLITNVIEQLKRPSDEHQFFVDFVGQELRSLKSEKSKKKLKNSILKLLIEIGNEDDL